MIKTAREIVEYFSTLEPDEPIHIEWFEREEAEANIGEDISKEQFVDIFSYVDDQGFIDAVSNALFDYEQENTND